MSDNIVIPPDSAGPKGPAVRFGGLQADRLYELARRKDAQSRVELGNTVTSLFVESDLSLREQEIISDILITMLKQAERDLRRSIADRLAALDKAPLRVVLHLANDEIEVAEKILAQSPVLEEMDLVLIIETQPSPYWQAIAERQDLRESVVRSLVQTRDYPTASVLVKNQNAIIPLDSFEVLVDMSNTANDLCVPLLGRRDLPPQMIADLYAIAATKIGQDVMMSLPPERRAEIEPHLADVAREYVQATKGNTDPTEMMIEAARSMKKKGRLTIEGMIQSLNNGQLASFMAQMMVFLEAGLPAIKDMLADASAQMMIALCRVNRVEKKMFLKMFLLSHKYRTGERVVDPMILNNALSQFDQMGMDECRNILKTIQKKN